MTGADGDGGTGDAGDTGDDHAGDDTGDRPDADPEHDYDVLHVPDVDPERSATSGTLSVNLTRELDLTEMRSKVRYLEPGDAMTYHRQHEQEELYYLLAGRGRMRIGDRDNVVELRAGTAVRVAADTPRQAFNDTDDDQVWLMIGAPPAEDDYRPPPDEA
jgi:mannose-6-phosphate isomerase-like protein (cupin superfamily)